MLFLSDVVYLHHDELGPVDSELKKLWLFVQTEFKENKDTMSKVTERIDTLEFSLGLARDNSTQLTKEKAKVNELLLPVQSQSMRNNFIFTGITEDINEKPEVTESKLRTFMADTLKFARDIVYGFQLKRVFTEWEITLVVLTGRVSLEISLQNFSVQGPRSCKTDPVQFKGNWTFCL